MYLAPQNRKITVDFLMLTSYSTLYSYYIQIRTHARAHTHTHMYIKRYNINVNRFPNSPHHEHCRRLLALSLCCSKLRSF